MEMRNEPDIGNLWSQKMGKYFPPGLFQAPNPFLSEVRLGWLVS